MTLAEFLSARIAEDEAVARSIDADPYGVFRKHGGTLLRWVALGLDRTWLNGKDRVLRECEAKRQIANAHSVVVNTYNAGPVCISCWTENAGADGPGVYPCGTLRTLAAIYSNHPDYDEGWKP